MGKHLILEMYDVNFELLNTLESLLQSMTSNIELANMTILNIFHHRFNPQGLTILFALAESHVSIHTFPEKGSLTADAYTCGDGNPEIIINGLIDYFKSNNYKIREFAR